MDSSRRVLGLEGQRDPAPGARDVDHKLRCAWNFFTGLYLKAGGVPWAPTTLRPGTCYVGISFYRPLGDSSGRIRTSIAQAFDEHGDGIVLRGQDFAWDEARFGNSPHLDADSARALIEMVLERYRAEMKQSPARVVLHKTSRYWDAEREGFLEALKSVREVDLLAVVPVSQVRLLRAGQYPPLRATRFRVGALWYLYTTGFIPSLSRYSRGWSARLCARYRLSGSRSRSLAITSERGGRRDRAPGQDRRPSRPQVSRLAQYTSARQAGGSAISRSERVRRGGLWSGR